MFEYRLPKMDHMTEEATIVEWLVREGDVVHSGDPLLQIETAKTLLEVKANFDGRIVEFIAPVGELLPVLTPIARVEEV